jgi:hypothetical protein
VRAPPTLIARSFRLAVFPVSPPRHVPFRSSHNREEVRCVISIVRDGNDDVLKLSGVVT